jgi:hypothetical protein
MLRFQVLTYFQKVEKGNTNSQRVGLLCVSSEFPNVMASLF